MKDRYGWARVILDQAIDAAEGVRDQETKDKIMDAACWTLRSRGVSYWRYLWMYSRALKRHERIMWWRIVVESK